MSSRPLTCELVNFYLLLFIFLSLFSFFLCLFSHLREIEELELTDVSPFNLYVTSSKVMVEEEAEVFRKGTVLLGPEEMEGEYAGEELRIEVSSQF